MKKNLSIILLLLVSFLSGQLFAQEKKRCGTTQYMARLKAEDPTLAGRMRDAEKLMQQEALKNQNTRTASTNSIIYIPVVFHVLYNTPAENISDNRIIDQVASLNKDYARLNADSNNTPAYWRPISANTGIQFCLARRDPSGNATTGIIRTPVTASGFDPETNDNAKFTALGGADAWPLTNYLNVWIVNYSGVAHADGILGITTFPHNSPPPHTSLADSLDGIMLSYTTVGGPNYHGTEPRYNLGRTLTHELGHWFWLYHVWGDDDNSDGVCQIASPYLECDGDDLINDTPNQGEENYHCPLYPRIDCCSSTPTGDAVHGVMFMNYMDYVDDNCMNMFTQGQSTRIHNCITSFRSGFPNSLGCLIPNGINEINSAILDLSVFPNPATGSITITSEFTGGTDVTILISNMVGEIVYTKELKNVSYINIPVDLSDKAQGIYNLTLRTTSALTNRKVILAR